MNQTPFTPIPTVDREGKILTTFTINGITIVLKQDIEAARQYINHLEEAIVKATNQKPA